MERQSKVSPHRDEEMKHELQGLLRSGHPTRSEEWHDPEPAADDDPAVAAGPVRGGDGDAERLRFELARHLGRTPFPAGRQGLLDTLDRRHAPDQLLDVVRDLPEDGAYRNVQDVVRALGRAPGE
jgi:hypothetical protein